MPGNILGQAFRLTSWGESHGPAIGGVIDGVPPGILLDIAAIQSALDRRRPGQHLTSPRLEADQLSILSGLFAGKTTGTPLAFQIQNENQSPAAYDDLKHVFRPGHADYAYFKKYGHVDFRGGGRASARETAVRVAAGAIALQVLRHLLDDSQNIHIKGALVQLGVHAIHREFWDWDMVTTNPFSCPDPTIIDLWTTYLTDIKDSGLSVGALIEVHAMGIPAGLGEPVYDKLDADFAKALMSINAVKGVEIGDGFASICAPVGYDEMRHAVEHHENINTEPYENANPAVVFETNRAGGILGGISTGQPIVCRIALKPTSSTRQPRKTIFHNGDSAEIEIHGRHDPCVGIRAVPIAEAMVALVLADHLIRWRGQCGMT